MRVDARTEGKSIGHDDHMRNELGSENAEGTGMLVYKGAAQVLEVLPEPLRIFQLCSGREAVKVKRQVAQLRQEWSYWMYGEGTGMSGGMPSCPQQSFIPISY